MDLQKTIRGVGLLCSLSAWIGGTLALAQASSPFGAPPSGQSESAQLVSPEQLDSLVAPIALYPDQLLSEVLAASTYPLEIVAAQQWLQRSGNLQGVRLQGVQLMDAARQQDWDPSVQALVAFPDALALLSRDVQWTTALGNAFLAQQSDVMNAIQRMRARAQGAGRLQSTPQQVVTTRAQDGQNAIEIQPANPQVMYVPSYNPQQIWGPPADGDYAQLGYPSYGQNSYGPSSYGQNSFGQNPLGEIFGAAVNLAGYFTGFGSLLGGGWGWILNWFTHSLLLNGLFFNSFGFHGGGYGGGFYGGGYGARSAWVHDPGHRMGVPYSNAAVAGRFGGTFRPVTAGFGSRAGFGSGGAFASRGMSGAGGWRTISGAGTGERSFAAGSAGHTQGFAEGRGFSSLQGNATGGWHSSGAGRPFAGSSLASNDGSGGNRGFSYGLGSAAAGNRGYSSNYSQGLGAGVRSGSSAGWASSARSSFVSPAASADRSFSRNAFGAGASSQYFSQPHSAQQRTSPQHFSAVKAPHFSAPKSSGSHFSSGGHGSGGGHSSGGHSHGGSHKH